MRYFHTNCITRIVFIFALLLSHIGVLADQSTLQDQAIQAFLKKDYSTALQHFLKLNNNSGRNYYNIGVCYYRLNQLDKAQQAFMAAALDKSVQALAYYNLALVAAKLDKQNEVNIWLDRLHKINSNKKLLTLSTVLRARVNGTPVTPLWYGRLSMGIGHDTNVLLGTDTSSGATSISDNFIQTQALLSGKYPDKTGLWAITVGNLQHKYNSNSQFDTANLFVRVGRQKLVNKDTQIEWDGAIFQTALDHSTFSQTIEFSGAWQSRLPKNILLNSRLSLAEVDAKNSIFSGIDGSRKRLDINTEWEKQSRLFIISYQYERNQRSQDNNSPTRYHITFDYRWTLASNIELSTALQWRSSHYKNLRDEQRRRLTIKINWRFDTSWNLSAKLRLTNNNSDEPDYEYHQNEIGLYLDWLF